MNTSSKKESIIWESIENVSYYLSSGEKKRAVAMFLLLFISSLLDVFGLASLVPVIMAASRPGSIFHNKYSLWLYENLKFSSERNFFVFLVLVLLLFFIVKNLFTTFINYKQEKFTARIALNVIDSQFEKHNRLPFWHFNQFGSAKLIHMTFTVTQSFINGIVRQLFVFFSEAIIVAVIVIGILIYKPALFMILIIVLVPAMLLIYKLLNKRSAHIGNQLNEARPMSYARILDAFTGFIELRLANKQEEFKQKVLKYEKNIQELDAKNFLFTQLPVKVIEVMAVLAVVTIFLYSLFFSNDPGSLVTIIGLFAAAAYRLMPSINRMLNAMVTMRGNRYAFDELIRFRSNLTQILPVQRPLQFNQRIEFNNITFSFPGTTKPMLRNISFEVNKGDKIGLIGSSGSGKTTLMNLLLRFYIEQQGNILVDDQPLTEENLEAWYKLIGYVKQDTFLMEASIQDNITLGDEQVDTERLRYAIEQASLQSFISTLPEGLATTIGERGSRLSGGQRQRIGIARALYKKTQVLVMDEATSALDNKTEREVSEAISGLANTNITMFIIAHRITTLKDCDRIYELRNGELFAEFQYDELISKTEAS
ncbi:ABC transporter ATP-binding protein [Hymenobacter jejuensis]|uniref:ABC transporter ATP-binding protein n=1 Tax=Hymenobacter jejuensis TaxID=2502781 RepID=A0A5B7ZXW4_9BACT|nr:ABC transporter ATP-binding protein [Hymenobacter jejuensis]QDA59346.1 ABC transporter ATP-binding protein [Hymenobacter jejuensis]